MDALLKARWIRLTSDGRVLHQEGVPAEHPWAAPLLFYGGMLVVVLGGLLGLLRVVDRLLVR